MEKLREIKTQTYLRLLAYAKPYKLRLAIGILAGFVVGGSLFGSLMLIPSLVTGIEFTNKAGAENDAAARLAADIEKAKTPEQREMLIRKVLDKPVQNTEGKIRKEVNRVNRIFHSIGMKSWAAEYEGGCMILRSGEKKILTFPAETPSGKITWQFFAVFCFGFILLWIFKNIATYVNHYCMRWVGIRVVTDLRNEIFRKLVNQSMRFYGGVDVGQMISRSTNDTVSDRDPRMCRGDHLREFPDREQIPAADPVHRDAALHSSCCDHRQKNPESLQAVICEDRRSSCPDA